MRTLRRWSRQDESGSQAGRIQLANELRELARGNAKAAVEAILEVMNDARTSGSPRLAAASIILDLAVGDGRGAGHDDDFAAVLKAADEISLRRRTSQSEDAGSARTGPAVKY